MIEITSIKYSIESEFHMLRHFEFIDNSILERLLSNGYSREEINASVSIVGSKFFSCFAADIPSLLKKINEYPFTVSSGVNGNLIIESYLPKESYPEGIGTHAVASIEALSEQLRTNLFYSTNRNYSLLHVRVNKLPSTNACTLIVKPGNEKLIFITAFPGEASMPLPDVKMSTDLYNQCKQYWDRHVFLEVM